MTACTDIVCIPALLAIARNPARLAAAKLVAASHLDALPGQKYPANGCAATQSALLQAAGIDIPWTFLASQFGPRLVERGWLEVADGDQAEGDIGWTCWGGIEHHGTDHVFLVLGVLVPPPESDEMIVVDNEAPGPHFRFASGRGGVTKASGFFRAPPLPAA